MKAEIISVTFTSPKCYYCENPWTIKVEIEPIDAETKEFIGQIVDVYVCQTCRDTKLKAFEDQIHSSTSTKIGEKE